METLQDVLHIHSLDDIGKLSTDNLRDAIQSLKPQSAAAYTVYRGMSEEESFDSRSWISHFSNVRDKAWSRLQCFGSNLVAKDCSCHIRERVLQICGEFCNHVAVCANSLSLFDVDWCVVCDGTGYNLTSDDGRSYRRPDACLAAKVRFYGIMPLIVVDVFNDSPQSRVRDSVLHWMNNYRSIHYVISVNVQLGETLAKESDDLSPPVVCQKIELQFPVRCTTNICVWSRDGLGIGMVPLEPERTSSVVHDRTPESTILTQHDDVPPSEYNDSFDFTKQLEDEPKPYSEEGPAEGRRCSTVLLSPSCSSIVTTDLAVSPSPTLGIGVHKDYFVPRKDTSLRVFNPKATMHRAFASCATLATVASESDFARGTPDLPNICVVAQLEASTTLSYKFSAGGMLQRSCGDTRYIVSRGASAVTVSEASISPHESLNALSGYNSCGDLQQQDMPGSPIFLPKNMSKEAILHRHSPVDFAKPKSSRSESNIMIHTAESLVGGFLLNIPLSNISKALQQLVGMSEKEMDKANVVRFVVNCRRIVNDGVLVGLTRDLNCKFRSHGGAKWQSCVQSILQNMN